MTVRVTVRMAPEHDGSRPRRPTLTEAEEDLLTAYSRGVELDLTARSSPDAEGKYSARFIRASFITDLLLSGSPVEPGRVPKLMVVGADIRGPLNLEFAQISYPVRLKDCTFDSPLTLTEARLQSLSLAGSTAPEIDAQHVFVEGDLHLEQLRLAGPLQLRGAHLKDDLHLEKAVINPTSRDPRGEDATLSLDGITVQGGVYADSLRVGGKVSIDNARVAGQFKLRNVIIRAPEGTQALVGESIAVSGRLDATGLDVTGEVRLLDAKVLGLLLRHIHIKNSATALYLDRLKCVGSVFCNEGSSIKGGLHAVGVEVGATFYLEAEVLAAPSAKTTESESIAVDLRRSRIMADLKVTRVRATGKVNVSDTQIGGQVSVEGTSLHQGAEGEETFSAERVTVASNLRCEDFNYFGCFNLRHAQIGGVLTIKKTEEDLAAPRTLIASGIRVARDVTIDTYGTVDLTDADVSGKVDLSLNNLEGPDYGAAADLKSARADILTLHGTPRRGRLDLTRVSVQLLRDSSSDQPEERACVLKGLQYGEIDPSKVEDRLKWLETGTRWVRKPAGGYEEVGFSSQPYKQLAETYRRVGKDWEARRVLCRMHRRHNSKEPWRRVHSKLWNYVQDLFVGYGYVPARALLWLLVIVTGASILFFLGYRGHPGFLDAWIVSLGLAFPGTGYFDKIDKIEQWKDIATFEHMVAIILVACSLLLGATVIAALGRFLKR